MERHARGLDPLTQGLPASSAETLGDHVFADPNEGCVFCGASLEAADKQRRCGSS
jgi:hypothetical protein